MSNDVLDLYDHEVKQIIELQALLNERRHGLRNYNDFEREIRDRFAAIGFTVDVNWYRFALDEVPQDGAMPEITITGRTEKHVFDPDRQVHEAVSNVLELPGEEGWIKTDPDTVRNFLEGNAGHGHGHGHSH